MIAAMPARIDLLRRRFALALLGLVALVATPGAAAQDEMLAPPAEQSAAEPEQPPSTEPEVDELARPYRTLATFRDAMAAWRSTERRASIERAVSCLQRPSDADIEVWSGYAERLDAVFGEFDRGVGEWLPRREDLGELRSYRMTLRHPDQPATLTLAFVRVDERWLIDEETVLEAVAVYDELELDPVQALLRRAGMEGLIESRFLGLRAYQWIGIFLVILLGVVVDFTLRAIVRAVTRRYLRRDEDQRTASDTKGMIGRAARPIGLIGGATLVYFLLPLLELPLTVELVLRTAAKTVALLAGVLAAYRIVDLVAEYFTRRAASTSNTFDDLLVPLIRKAAKVFVLAFGLVFLAEALHLPLASLVAGVSIGGIAIAFAARDTIANLFGSVAVILDRPFSVGDWIVVGDVEGIVEELGFRSTRVRTFYNSLITLPNATLISAHVDNYGRRAYRRFKTNLALTYDTPPDRIEAFCEGIRELIRRHPNTRKDSFEVHLNTFGAHSLDVLVYMFFRTRDWSSELRERHRFMLDVLRLAERLEVRFAFPTQTVQLERGDRGDDREPQPRRGESELQDDGRAAAAAVVSGAPTGSGGG